jgi:alkyl sulfatase BDS1-like metallo-beta-lactamase superfamily hydrolase
MGYQAESGPWRDFYLTGAQELRHGHPAGLGANAASKDTVAAMTTEQLIDFLGVSLDGLAAAEHTWTIDVTVTDRDERWLVGVERGAVHAGRVAGEPDAPVRIVATHEALATLVFGAQTLAEIEATGALAVTGDRAALERLLRVVDRFTMMFPIVTP